MKLVLNRDKAFRGKAFKEISLDELEERSNRDLLLKIHTGVSRNSPLLDLFETLDLREAYPRIVYIMKTSSPIGLRYPIFGSFVVDTEVPVGELVMMDDSGRVLGRLISGGDS